MITDILAGIGVTITLLGIFAALGHDKYSRKEMSFFQDVKAGIVIVLFGVCIIAFCGYLVWSGFYILGKLIH